MERCALCHQESREAVLTFDNVRRAERVTLEIALCEECADRVEKHLKRMVPKRLMRFVPLRALERVA